MQNKLPISLCLISGAEAHRIRQCLDSAKDWVSEIVIVLNEEVADGTDVIAAEYGAKVYREPWKGFLGQKNSVTEKATQPWILNLDADEVVSEPLRKEIEQAVTSSKFAYYSAFNFPRLTQFAGRWIRHGDWYPDRVLRLWKRGSGKWGGLEPHTYPVIEGKIGKLNGDLLHYSNESINRMLRKIGSYSDAFLKNKLDQGAHPSILDIVFRPLHRFIRAYFLRLGFLDGWQGYYIAWISAFDAATRYVKLFEYRAEQELSREKQDKDTP